MLTRPLVKALLEAATNEYTKPNDSMQHSEELERARFV